ncbi:MAG: molybdopterin-binding protein [Aestuariivita sp.]|nr:molybdopterin-binding protein [Aestuariivita sp.]MCY4201973.1 molybdopterin-binding protein [Aestuariivita sp.]MCY4288217.1 molybdopterin-binding protein [Aestuariivita sp.]MCY4346218.1 molybdopterin-binding protein [Aestuariivita sp.]
MKFGRVPLAEAEGAILAHSLALGNRRLRKGIVLTTQDLNQIEAHGIIDVVAARLETSDLHEDTAARRLAAVLVPTPTAAHMSITPAFNGRVNFLAASAGVVTLDEESLSRFNSVDPMVSIATLPPFQQVSPGDMVATIKIISYGVSAESVATAASFVDEPIRVIPPVLSSASLIISEIDQKLATGKGERVIAKRLNQLGLDLVDVTRTQHSEAEIAAALKSVQGDLVLILTASATSDSHDVAPSAVRAAGGNVERFGMPVDPGNLLFLASIGKRFVIGLPGCARSPALNGADWVLSRIVCGIDVTSDDIAKMGVGGLLKEIPTRPQPRRQTRAQL